jgi:hypothetical protein
MTKTISKLLLIAFAAMLYGCGQGEVSFSNDIEPIFETHCIRCHDGS